MFSHSMHPNTTIQLPHLLEFPIIKRVCLCHSVMTANCCEMKSNKICTSYRCLPGFSSITIDQHWPLPLMLLLPLTFLNEFTAVKECIKAHCNQLITMCFNAFSTRGQNNSPKKIGGEPHRSCLLTKIVLHSNEPPIYSN